MLSPALFAGGLTAWQLGIAYRPVVETSLQGGARTLAVAIDREIEVAVTAVGSLAATRALRALAQGTATLAEGEPVLVCVYSAYLLSTRARGGRKGTLSLGRLPRHIEGCTAEGAAMTSSPSGRWSPRPVAGFADGTVLYDGVCVICSRFFRFVAARDPAARFRFAAVQDPLGQRLAAALGIDPVFPETNAVVIDGIALMKSDAGIAILQRLPRWGWARHLRLVPRPLRDWLYDRVARNRYRLFGRTETCMIPDAALRRHIAR